MMPLVPSHRFELKLKLCYANGQTGLLTLQGDLSRESCVLH